MDRTICLASSSESRKKTLQRARVRFVVIPSNIVEIFEGESPEDYVKKLAQLKGQAIIGKTNADIIVAADSVAVYNNQIIGKPTNREDAISIITKLQDVTHTFLTGMCVINTNTQDISISSNTTEVTFTPLSNNIIANYVDRFKPYSYAGGYDNGISSWFIEKISGSQSNLMGLPMHTLRNTIESMGYTWFEFIE